MKFGRSWFRFSLRTFLIVVCIAALGVRIYVSRMNAPIQLPLQWDTASGKNILWSANVGSVSWKSPAVGAGKVFLGCNNSAGWDPQFPSSVDGGVLLCFSQDKGRFLWQHFRPKLASGRMSDWPQQGTCCTPLVEQDRLYYVSNRAELVCLDVDGFHDGENDGPFVGETSTGVNDADVVWSLDMIGRLGVHPHNCSCSNVIADAKCVYVNTGNAVSEDHVTVVNPLAPSLIAVDKQTGDLVWKDSSPGDKILHGQWSSPILARIAGRRQLLFAAGDGWLYSFDPSGDGKGGSRLLWRFDANEKSSTWRLGGRGERNNLVATPTVVGSNILLVTGQDPEHGEGPASLWCVRGDGEGDVSPTLVTRGTANSPQPPRTAEQIRRQTYDPQAGEVETPNPNSRLVWQYTGADYNGNGTIEDGESFHRSMSRPIVVNDLVFCSDGYGSLHCVDLQTGKGCWNYDLFAVNWSALFADSKHVFAGTEDGDIMVFVADRDPNIAMPFQQPLAVVKMPGTVYAPPAVEKGVLYLAVRGTLYAISE